MKIRLVVTSPAGDKKVHTFDQDNVVVGSSVAANLRLEAEGVAGLHVMIRIDGEGKVTFLDMGGKTGVLLNGKKAKEAAFGKDDVLDVAGFKVGMAALAVEPEEITEAEMIDDKPAAAPVAASTAKPAVKAAPKKTALPPPRKIAKKDRGKWVKRVVRKSGPVAPVIPVIGSSLAEDRPTSGNRAVSAIYRWAGSPFDERAVLKAEKPITLGTAGGNSFVVPEEYCPHSTFEFLQPGNGEWTVNIPEGWEFGYVDPSGVVPPSRLEERKVLRKGQAPGAAWSFQLDNENACYFKNGPIQFDVRYVVPKRAIREGFWKSMDKLFMASLIACTVLMLIVVTAVIILFNDSMMTPPDDLNKQLNRFTKMIVKAPEKKKEDVPELKLKAVSLDATKAPGKLEKIKANVKGPNIADPNKREQDRKIALKSGLLGALRGSGGAAMSSIFGAGGLGSGINNALTGLHGTMIGDSGGLGGLGSRGGGGGGGGAIGIGGIGTYGGGKSGRGYGNVNIGGGGKGETAINASKLILVGGLEKEVIARIIQRHWAQVKYCYEKELTKNPNLYGKVVVQFTIGGTGKVDEGHISQTEMNNEAVEGCIIRNVKMWVFPQPKGGGQVYVTYPFIFKSAGQ